MRCIDALLFYGNGAWQITLGASCELMQINERHKFFTCGKNDYFCRPSVLAVKVVADRNSLRFQETMADKWRDARVVEEARLESVYTCQRVSRVRIPIPPPSPAEAIWRR